MYPRYPLYNHIVVKTVPRKELKTLIPCYQIGNHGHERETQGTHQTKPWL